MKNVMKILTLATAITSANAQAASANKKEDILYKCDTTSDPDSIFVTILRDNGRLIASLSEEGCDGDCGGSDLVYVKQTKIDDKTIVFEQEGSTYPKSRDKVSRTTRGLRIELTFGANEKHKQDGEGPLSYESGPIENVHNEYDMTCTPAK